MISPLSKIKEEIKSSKLDAVLISSVPNIVYLTGYAGFFTAEREGFLLICKNNQYFITDPRSGGEIRERVKDFELAEISTYFPLKKLFKKLADKHKIKLLGIEENNLTVSEFKLIKKHFKTRHFDLKKIKSIKNSDEVLKIEKACELGDKTFDFILKKIKLGVSEKEIAREIEFFIKKHGGDLSFPSIVAFGKNSAIPHHVPTFNSQLSTFNSIVLLDFGVKLNNYCSDMTRTIFFGKASQKFKKMYNTVLEAQKIAIQQFNNLAIKQLKIKASEIDKIARNYIISKGYETIPHSLGHGIGLEVHESPSLSPKSKNILKIGMVFSIEPGIYLPNFGGVRIEDLVVLKKSGLPAGASAKVGLLTHSPKNLIEI